MPFDFQRALRKANDAVSNTTKYLASPELWSEVNSNRDTIQQSRFDAALNQSDKDASERQKLNRRLNERLYTLQTEQSKAISPVNSDLGKQIEHLKNMGYYARPSRFSFFIEGIPSKVNERLVRNCTNLVIPGRSFLSQAFKIYGTPLDQVYETNYSTEITMTFRVGEDMMERDMFEGWMNLSLSYDTADVSYPDDYMTCMRIYQLDRKDGYLYSVRLNSVFCKGISDMELSSDSSDQVHVVQVVLGYSDYAVVGKTTERIFDINRFENELPSPSERKKIYPDSGKRTLEGLMDRSTPRNNEPNLIDLQTLIDRNFNI